MILTDFEDFLHSHGVSATATRHKIFNFLLNQNTPLTMNELILAFDGVIDRSSVYRNVELFEKINVVVRIYTGWKYRLELSEQFHYHHHHITCTNCGESSNFEESGDFTKSIKNIGLQHGFLVTEHQLELKGLCSSCKK